MLDRGATPPGWESDLPDNSMYIFLVNLCERVSIGPFERGPATFIMEMHWGNEPPEACQQFEPSYEQAATLLSIWVDDPDIAGLLRDELQMPVVLGTVASSTASQNDVELQTWTWQAEGQDASSLVVGHPGGSETRGNPVDRIAWHNGTGVQFMDLAQEKLLPDKAVPTGQGTLAPPMRYASQDATPFAGLASVWKDGDFYGPIYRFGDLECKQPLF